MSTTEPALLPARGAAREGSRLWQRARRVLGDKRELARLNHIFIPAKKAETPAPAPAPAPKAEASKAAAPAPTPTPAPAPKADASKPAAKTKGELPDDVFGNPK